MDSTEIRRQAEAYYTNKIEKHGASPAGVDWNSLESQELRFQQLTRIINGESQFTINDFGCGYGALVNYLDEHYKDFQYTGFDISEKMIMTARNGYSDRDDLTFFKDRDQLVSADYTVASGIFSVKQNIDEKSWHAYILESLHELDNLSRHGFAFNALTTYSDAEKMRADLYYANPLELFNYCKENFSAYVALLHDYPLFEFTILVRK